MNRLNDDITLALCVDSDHLNELKFAWSTWRHFKPELTNLKNKLIIYDAECEDRLSELNFLDSSFSLYRFDKKSFYSSQRDAMLTSWLDGVSQIQTDYYIKIDTDCFAVNYDNKWVDIMNNPKDSVIISNPWGYTKNPERILTLEKWGDKIDLFKSCPRLNLRVNPGSDKVVHPRIISFIGLFNTQWTKQIIQPCWIQDHYKLPDPSQDTFTWYCAQRLNSPISRVSFKKFGFIHTRLKKAKRHIEDKHGIRILSEIDNKIL